MIGAVSTHHARLERRMRQRRAVKVIVLVALAVIWVPIALVMLAAGVADRRA